MGIMLTALVAAHFGILLPPYFAECNTLNGLVSEVFIRFFVETVGHYSLFLTQNEKGERAFQREAFRKSVASKSIRRFLEVFMESQMFAGFIQDRELRKCRAKGKGGCLPCAACFTVPLGSRGLQQPTPPCAHRESGNASLKPCPVTRKVAGGCRGRESGPCAGSAGCGIRRRGLTPVPVSVRHRALRAEGGTVFGRAPGHGTKWSKQVPARPR